MFFYNPGPLQMFYNTENSGTRNDNTKMGNLEDLLEDKHKPPTSTPRRKGVVTELETDASWDPDIFFLSFFSICN